MPTFYNNCNLTLDVNVICDIYRCQKGARGATRNLDCLFFHRGSDFSAIIFYDVT